MDYLVLDEADEMLAMGFAEEVERILAETAGVQAGGAVLRDYAAAIRKLTTKYLHDPIEVKVEAKTATAENISQRYIQVAGPRKMDALTRILEVEPFEAMIVSSAPSRPPKRSPKSCAPDGFSAAAINGDIPQAVA